jgi:DNA-binding transcriptional MerR regulator
MVLPRVTCRTWPPVDPGRAPMLAQVSYTGGPTSGSAAAYVGVHAAGSPDGRGDWRDAAYVDAASADAVSAPAEADRGPAAADTRPAEADGGPAEADGGPYEADARSNVADAVSAAGDAGGSAEAGTGTREYRIGELARAAGISVRTLRYYQERKLLPPPRHEGRIAWYSRAHLTRLRVIGQLLERGHTLGGTAELLSAWEQGYNLAELLGFERAMTAPWSDEVRVPVTVGGGSELLGGQLTPEILDEVIRLGYVEVDGDRVAHVSRRLLDTTAILVREGIPLSAILAVGGELQAGLDKLASLFVDLVTSHILDGSSGPPPPREVARLAETVERLRPVARIVIDAEFARAMDRRARATYSEFIRLLAARDRLSRPDDPDGSGGTGPSSKEAVAD